MLVYLVRHGHAVDEHDGLDDAARYLSRKGRRIIREVGRVLHDEGVSFDAMLTSPLVRAVQTAELLAGICNFVDEIEAVPALALGHPPRLVAELLAERGQAVALIGHEPSMTALGALLCSRPSFPPFRKAQVSVIEDGQPKYYIDPDTRRRERLLLS